MNNTNYLHKTATAALGLTLLLQGSLSWADDTDIYFTQPPSNIKPNIFFILDDSGSMDGCMTSGQRPASSACPGADKRQRIDVLKATMKTLLDGIENNSANVGLMSLRYQGHTGWTCKTTYGGYPNGYGTYCPGGYYPHPTWGTAAPLRSRPVKEINNNVRNILKNTVNALTPANNTPATMSLYDAARYLTNEPAKHNGWAISGGVNNKKSPIVDECQPTHVVLLTDGQANMDVNVAAIQSLTGKICATRSNASERCAPELAAWMRESSSTMFPTQVITTHTIGFALNALPGGQSQGVKNYLKDIADAGGGLHRTADQADELLDAFNEIIQQSTQAVNVSLVNPSPAGGDYKSDEHKKQIYYPMFQPVTTDRWPGNLKRYGLKVSGGNLVEIDNSQPAINAKGADGQFVDNARSWWSTTAEENDGNDVKKGGVAYRLPAPNARHLWTFINGAMEKFPTVQTNGNNINITPANNNVVAKLSNNAAERRKIMRYIRGFNDDNTNTPRRALGDPLHSAPTLFSYACQGSFNSATGKCTESSNHENTQQMAIIGTNEGFVQMFSTTTGEEQFAFMPEELLGNVKKLYQDQPAYSNVYGMDNTVTVWVNDKNNNGKVDGDDKVYAYASMRRGGESLYALDITNKNKPKLKWKISSGDPGFERLGQTWSVPVKTKIDVAGTITDVLIFGGGYDTAQDTPSNYRQPGLGNDIYIVNAISGELIRSVNQNPEVTAMKYSIPGNVRVLSLDNNGKPRADGLATQFFVGDVGGQIWRFFIDNGKPKEQLVIGGGTSNNGLFADFSGTDIQDYRRFYHGPEVASDDNGKLFVIIGSGYRANPKNKWTDDRLYSMHVPLNDNGQTFTENDLHPIKDGKFNGDLVSAGIQGGKKGWYLELKGAGEKIISTPKTVKGRLFFNTYSPPDESKIKPCDPASSFGTNLSFNVDALTGAPSDTPGNYADHALISQTQGALGDPNVICFEGNCWVQFGRGEFSEPFSRQAELGLKTYWMDLAE